MSTPKSEEIGARLEILRSDANRFIGNLEGELEKAKGQRLTEQYQEELKAKIQQARSTYGTLVSQVEAELVAAQKAEAEALQRTEAEIKANAAAVKEDIKKRLLMAWIQSGGDPDSFELAWPALYQAEMIKRTSKKVEDPTTRANANLITRTF
jgi:hypothetical protein